MNAAKKEPKRLLVKMRKFNMAGKRAGAVLSVEERDARDWIARGWADEVEPPKAAAPGRSS